MHRKCIVFTGVLHPIRTCNYEIQSKAKVVSIESNCELSNFATEIGLDISKK